MNWRLIFVLSGLSIPLGVASVLGVAGNDEWLMWLLAGIFCALQFARKANDDLFLHGFYLGIFCGMFSSFVQAMFVATYLANNPRMFEVLNMLPQDLPPRGVLLIMGPLIGVVSGIVFGILSVVAATIMRRPSTEIGK